MIKKRKNKGITLVALVITIIILLILAGISISALTGSGLFKKAQQAQKETENAQLNENTTLSEYEDSINGYISGTGENTPSFDASTLSIGEATNTDKYGWKVTNYNVQTSDMSTNVWRLFYQDSNYTYIITDDRINVKPSDYYTTIKNEKDELKYQTGADVSVVGQKLSSKISLLFVKNNSHINIKATAWLTDTSEGCMWAKYRNSDAVFVIGSPTAELYEASYNNRSNKSSNTIVMSLGAIGYKQNTSEGWLDSSNHEIYYPYYMLASPSSSNGAYMLAIHNAYKCVSSTMSLNGSASLRPVACIPTPLFNKKYELANE